MELGSQEPEQLDLLDWIAAKRAPVPAETHSSAVAQVGSVDQAPAPVPIELAPVRLTRVDPARNLRRVYSLALVRSLWGEAGVRRQWGRIGTQGQSRTDWHASAEAARAELERVAGAKRRRGYR